MPFLQRRPAFLLLDPSIGGECEVALDGVPRGTVQGLDRQVEVRRPEVSHVLEIRCPERDVVPIALEPLLPGSTFPVGAP